MMQYSLVLVNNTNVFSYPPTFYFVKVFNSSHNVFALVYYYKHLNLSSSEIAKRNKLIVEEMLCTKKGLETSSKASQLTQLSRPATTTKYLCQSKFPKISNNTYFPSSLYRLFINHSRNLKLFQVF